MTKMKGDIAEQAVILEGLNRGMGVLRPIGDRLPYDLVFDINNKLVKIQVKAAWLDKRSNSYKVDNRRCNTNRRHMFHSKYNCNDFDFAIAYIIELNVSYIFPFNVFTSYGGVISMIENEKRQRKPLSSQYRNRWDLIENYKLSRDCIIGNMLGS